MWVLWDLEVILLRANSPPQALSPNAATEFENVKFAYVMKMHL